jgi:hypothetical protein
MMEARPMGTDCSATQLDFEGFGGRQVVGAFDGGDVSSNGGAPLLREADRAIGLTAKVARCFRDMRKPAFVEHRIETLLAQRVHAIVLRHEDLNDHDELRFDSALGLVSDTLRPRCEEPDAGKPVVATLAGKSTLNRLEHGLMGEASRYCKIGVDEAALERVFLDIYIEAHERPPKRVIFDLDATDDTTEDQRRACPSRPTRHPFRTPVAVDPQSAPQCQRSPIKLNAVVRNAG